jgi:ribosome maturation factor RimP
MLTSSRPLPLLYNPFLVVILLLLVPSSSAWTSTRYHHHPDAWSASLSFATTTTTRTTSTHRYRQSTSLLLALPAGYQEFGESVIRTAGASCGVEKDEDLTIEWKAGRIIVTVHGTVYVSNPDDDTDEDAVVEEDEGEDDDDDEEEEQSDTVVSNIGDEDAEEDDGEEPTDTPSPPPPPVGVDMTGLARAINAGLDDEDGMGFAIAEVHEIEVTTPGAKDELSGSVMFDAYRGFDVICQQMDTKTKKIRQVEGKLVERNDEFTTINIKGRFKKMKNSTVVSVKLPKAKSEKGGIK